MKRYPCAISVLLLAVACGTSAHAAPFTQSLDATGDTVFDSGFEITPVQGACVNFYSDSFVLAEGETAGSDTAHTPTPDKGVPFAEPSFNTCVVRATHHSVEYPPAAFLREDYSRRQSYNADNSRFFVFGSNGFWHLYNSDSLAYMSVIPGVAGDNAEPQWDPGNPALLYYLPLNGGTKMYSVDVTTNVSQVVADFLPQLPAWAQGAQHISTKAEGSPSQDARYWGFIVQDGSFTTIGYMVWDLQQNHIVGSRPTTVQPDHGSMTPSGRWFTVSGFDGVYAWSPDFSLKKKLHHTTEHSDIAIGANGHDTFVSLDYQSNGGDVFYIDIDACPAVAADVPDPPECPRTVLFPTYVNGSTTALHISGKGYRKPGWVVITPYGTALSRDGTMPWYGNKVFAMQLDPNPRVYELARHHSLGVAPTAYWSEPQSTTNRDLTRIMFNSSWYGTDQTNVEAYLIQLPADAIE